MKKNKKNNFKLLELAEIINLLRKNILIISILVLALFLRIHKLDELMMFIGDFAWFYISARDMILTGDIPLLGITSSQTWLHQGPLWTYLLAILLSVFNFNPLSAAYFTAILGTITVCIMYKTGTILFSRRTGIIAAFLYATSPLVIVHSRMPYHTSPIPLFMALFLLAFYKWISGNIRYFPMLLFLSGVLYNFELATVVLWFIIFFVLVYGIWRKKEWARHIFTRKVTFFSIVGFTIPMTPIFLYDFQHEFVQTAKFAHWVIYHRIIKFFLDFDAQNASSAITFQMLPFFTEQYKRLVFLGSSILAFIIFLVTLSFFASITLSMIKEKKIHANYLILILCFLIPFIGFLVNKTPSEAYTPIFFPTIIFFTALLFDKILNHSPVFLPVIAILAGIGFLNVYILISKNYLMGNGYGFTYRQRLSASQNIVEKSNGKEYNLIGKGNGSIFESFTMPYEYLTWRLGHPPSDKNQKIKILIEEKKSEIVVSKKSSF